MTRMRVSRFAGVPRHKQTRGAWLDDDERHVCHACAAEGQISQPMVVAIGVRACEQCGAPLELFVAGSLPLKCGCFPDHRPDCPIFGNPAVRRRD